jgi:serine/threonine-protein kinase
LIVLLLGYKRATAGREKAGGPTAGDRPLVGLPSAASRAPATEAYGSYLGPTFGRYRLIDRLGSGGMAEVYTAVTFGAEGFRRTFVVKRLHAELARHPAAVAQFIDEANLGSSLVHSNIVPVFDFGKVGNEYFLAQEYILGRDLGRVTARIIERRGKPLSAPLVLYIARETCKALDYAHTKLDKTGKPMGLVHRDVSPENVLISALGEVKLLDFGIVKADGRVSKTQDGLVKGTARFMSPEQARASAVDARADLFSLGLVIFYCLTGETLYSGDATHEVLFRASQGPSAEELARLVDLPAPFPAILLKALRTDPAERYQTAAAFGAALSPHVGDVGRDLVDLMQTLFAADLQQEETHFAAAAPNSGAAADDEERPRQTTPTTQS